MKLPKHINLTIEHQPHAWGNLTLVNVAELNVEATIHHGVRRPICYDRKVCERARRKAARKSE